MKIIEDGDVLYQRPDFLTPEFVSLTPVGDFTPVYCGIGENTKNGGGLEGFPENINRIYNRTKFL